MTFEQYVLLAAIVLGIFQLGIAGAAATKVRGKDWNLGPRDEAPKPLPGGAGRLERAFGNFRETFPFFLAAVCLNSLRARGGVVSEIGAALYLGARVVYVPLYYFGVTGVRTIVWIISLVGILLILAQLFA